MSRKLLFRIARKKASYMAALVTTAFFLAAVAHAKAADTENLFIKMVDDLKNMGDECRENGLSLQANYFYAQADVAVSSFRLAVSRIYAIRKQQDEERRKKEAEEARAKQQEEDDDDDWKDLIVDDGGWFALIDNMEETVKKLDTINAQLEPIVARIDSIDEAIRDNQYNLWHLLAAKSPASPFPWLFEGVVAAAKGRNERAAECFSYAVINPNLYRLGEGWDFSFISNLPLNELAALHKRLDEKEIELQNLYIPKSNNFPRHFLIFDDTYLRLLAKDVLIADSTDFTTAYSVYEAAVRANPFEPANFAGCGLMGVAAGYIDEAAYYINQGLLLDPEHKGLNILKQAWNGGAK